MIEEALGVASCFHKSESGAELDADFEQVDLIMTQSPDPTTPPDTACRLNGGAKGDDVFHTGSTSSTSTSTGASSSGNPLSVIDLGLNNQG